MTVQVTRTRRIVGTIRPPSDKSLTHRAYCFAAMAVGPSEVHTPLRGEDCESTLRCLNQLGLRHEWQAIDTVRLMPSRLWSQPKNDLDCGNSGTTMRLLSGLVASRDLSVRLVGDASLSKRPMGRIAEPLRQMGAQLVGERPPIEVHGTDSLTAIDYVSPVASAQVKSCILLAGLRAQGSTSVTEPSLSRDHTERMLVSMGIPVQRDGLKVTVHGGSTGQGFRFRVPGDISSAAFLMVAAAMLPGSDLRILDVNVNPTRTGILDVFEQAGVPVEQENLRDELGEPVADLRVRGPESLRPFEIAGDLVPRLIDEIPVLAVLATRCEGTSVIRDARELRVKESDRIELVSRGLAAMGATVEATEDGMVLTGPSDLKGASIEARGDHRIAMAFAIAGLVAEGETTLGGTQAIATSYPNFWDQVEGCRVP